LKSVTVGTANRHGFFIQDPGRFSIAKISLDLPKTPERTKEIESSARLTRESNGLRVEPMRV
jgi:hypothetical protein